MHSVLNLAKARWFLAIDSVMNQSVIDKLGGALIEFDFYFNIHENISQ